MVPSISRCSRTPETSRSVAETPARFSIRGKISVGDHWFEGRRENDVHSIEQNPPIHQEGNSIHVDYVNMRNISIDYEISVPTDATFAPAAARAIRPSKAPRATSTCRRARAMCGLAHLTGEFTCKRDPGMCGP